MLKKKPKPDAKPKKKSSSAASDVEIAAGILAGIVEAGFLMAAADGKIVDEEVALLAGLIHSFSEGAASEEQIVQLINACDEALTNDGYDARVAAVAKNLPNHETKHQALLVAAMVLAADDEFDEENEGGVYVALAKALGIHQDEALQVLQEAQAMYEA